MVLECSDECDLKNDTVRVGFVVAVVVVVLVVVLWLLRRRRCLFSRNNGRRTTIPVHPPLGVTTMLHGSSEHLACARFSSGASAVFFFSLVSHDQHEHVHQTT